MAPSRDCSAPSAAARAGEALEEEADGPRSATGCIWPSAGGQVGLVASSVSPRPELQKTLALNEQVLGQIGGEDARAQFYISYACQQRRVAGAEQARERMCVHVCVCVPTTRPR